MKPNEQTLKNLEKLKEIAGYNKEEDSIDELKQMMRKNFLTKEDFIIIHNSLNSAYCEAKEQARCILESYEHLMMNAERHGFYEEIPFSCLQRDLSIKRERGLKNDQK